ncbi:MAG: aminoglycoside phosphotransferase family protein [Candidatus Woesearchaeota archaeon]
MSFEVGFMEWRQYAQHVLKEHSLDSEIIAERQGYNHHTFISKDAVVRIPLNKHTFEGEIWALKKAGEKKVKVPRIISYNNGIKTPYLLEERLRGEHITSETINPDICRQAGKALAKIHSIQTRNYGWINNAGTGRYKNWKPYLENRRQNIDIAVREGLLELGEKRIMHELYDLLAAQPEKQPVLLHGDFQFNNLLFENGQLTGVIDFAPRSGPPAFDIGGLSACLNARHFKDFEEGYGKRINTMLAHIYAIDKLIGMMVFYKDKKPEIIPRLQKKLDFVIEQLTSSTYA